ncbi:Twin-arginine translocation pathway signal sequence domain protein [Sulfitobacter noctilucicola]|uniref:Uncharacterized protein (DUF1501 family) n=1 Tax=Sulfitobacter noctilucicola TaxID=1342301 RepID=A0A7W6MAL1_9RHOB|nr:DUF1501 domain-containing protein [Sulfitobacter noctilucicola]KIN63239.1 Twin-arginine translocation pathway signal sequence domain protein [Sulfitobacter noctilucicola]MBB4175242.1 uncharacterized protein (DUF1501 family) [Sulfitobacter noctilucicola]
MTDQFTRRGFLGKAGLLGCSLAASPLLTPVTLASAPWDTRLIVIILRGGMDGLDVVRPTGDPAYAALRPGLSASERGPDLDGYFTLHPALATLMPLWRRQQLGFVHAVSTPYRNKRSHFDGQDMLEAGTERLSGGVRDGWLNRMLQEVPDIRADTAFAIGNNDLRLLNGDAPVANWTPDANLKLSAQTQRLAELVMEEDPEMHAALAEAEMLSAEGPNKTGGQSHMKVARFVASRLRGSARVAAFSLNGWDTHRSQERVLSRSLERLAQTISTLKSDLGEQVWGKTALIAMTEFGRTARENGTGGTDHGTGGLMLMAGGAVRGGQVHGRWPGVGAGALYQERDLMPTQDVRAPAAWIMRGLTGLDRSVFERRIFPGLDMGNDPNLLP